MSDKSNRLRAKFAKTIREVTVYREQDESYGDEGDDVRMSMDSVFHVANQTETKKLNDKNVEAVLFTIGGSPGWFWMPKAEFVQATEPHDVKTLTSTPFKH
jgi:hypothetical protein